MGFLVEGKEHMVCKLKKSIYELKKASRQWYLKFNDTIVSFGFKENNIDRCIYLKLSGSKVTSFHIKALCNRLHWFGNRLPVIVS